MPRTSSFRKGVDLLVANNVAEPGSASAPRQNRVTILGSDGGRDELPLLTERREVADRLLDRVVRTRLRTPATPDARDS